MKLLYSKTLELFIQLLFTDLEKTAINGSQQQSIKKSNLTFPALNFFSSRASAASSSKSESLMTYMLLNFGNI